MNRVGAIKKPGTSDSQFVNNTIVVGTVREHVFVSDRYAYTIFEMTPDEAESLIELLKDAIFEIRGE